ncbi:tetratricopeptide repeat protein [Paenibacillus thailandensis]|uniref:Tetratricopeptide repeat protein n=1 Tax=Paenibacillus thailandensis TaxID=393250 RepID=A0ABW5R2E7_9BACL
MGKFFILFVLLNFLTGNPIVSVIIILVLFYALERRFIGLTPSIVKPLRRLRQIGKLKKRIDSSPNDVSSKLELARLLMERKKYRQARELLEPLEAVMTDSAEYADDLGVCLMETGNPVEGVAAVRRALELNPRVKYGEPHLRLAAYYARRDAAKALDELESFQRMQSSSCEAYLRLASIYKQMGRGKEAKAAVKEGLNVYRLLPRYKKKTERASAIRLWVKSAFG